MYKRQVYEYVVKDPEKVKYMRIRELADEVHVSTSTILRFCKKMGCSGYSEFKLQLRDYQTRNCLLYTSCRKEGARDRRKKDSRGERGAEEAVYSQGRT